ncbi:MAG: GTPase ObgE, partial [Candidatus Spyradenecus sp.]
VGLGLTFLRHISRSRMLVYVLDMADTENLPEEAYRVLRAEVESYDPELAARPALVLANKMDEPQAQAHYAEFVQAVGFEPIRLSLTAEGKPGLDAVKRALREALQPRAKGASEVRARSEEPIDHSEVSAERFRKATFLKP